MNNIQELVVFKIIVSLRFAVLENRLMVRNKIHLFPLITFEDKLLQAIAAKAINFHLREKNVI